MEGNVFWKERGRGATEQNGAPPPCGQVRVLVAGDSGVGKTSLVHLIVNGFSIDRPPQTVGCTVGVKHITYGSYGSSSDTASASMDRDFFVELWDVSGHKRYKDCRPLFYSQINGVIFVHDLSQRRTKASLQKWLAEVARNGTFSAPQGSSGPFGLPVPYLVIGNKADIATKEGMRASHGDLIDAARQWVEKQGLLPSSEELPLSESFPGSGSLISAAKEARFDKEAVMKFFHMLIRRRYFSDDLNSPNLFSVTPLKGLHPSNDDVLPINPSLHIEHSEAELRRLPPLPAQHSLTPPPTLNPQQPVSISDHSRALQQYGFRSSLEPDRRISRRSDINV